MSVDIWTPIANVALQDNIGRMDNDSTTVSTDGDEARGERCAEQPPAECSDGTKPRIEPSKLDKILAEFVAKYNEHWGPDK